MRNFIILALLVSTIGCQLETTNPISEISNQENSLDLDKIMDNALALERLQKRGSLYFEPNHEEPFSGWVLKMHHGDSQVHTLGLIENGHKKVWFEFYSFIRTFNFLRPKFDRKKVSLTFKDGKQDGLSEKWHANGKPSEKGIFKSGLKEGEWNIWDQKGAPTFNGNFLEGKEDGTHSYWWANGQLQKNQNFKNGILEGKSWETYRNGQVKFEGEYSDGKKDGIWTYWKENGEEIKTETYSKGELVKN